MKRTQLFFVPVVAALALLAPLASLTPAGAAPPPAPCVLDLIVSGSPGLTMTPGRTDGDANGTIDCHGVVDGKQITGAGSYSNTFSFLDSTCAKGGGNGTQTFTIPTSAGPMTITEDFTFASVGPAGTFKGTALSGAFQFAPMTGDCVTSPASKAAAHAVALLMR
jgi:hypothetical protein